ncbi:MAG: MFS transporter, partial [Microbacteriaceae bacterium]
MAVTQEPENPEYPLTRPVSTVPVRKKYFAGLFAAQFGLFVALLTPVLVGMQLKVQEIAPDNAAELLAAVLPFGALGAVIANPLAGQLSDRTRSRWGRRRPWLIGGIVAFMGALMVVAFAQDQLGLTIGWVLAQVSANAVLAALVASFADNVPEFQRGKGSSIIAIAQNTAIMVGTYASVLLVANLPVLFIAPGILAIIAVVWYALVARDEVPERKIKPLNLGSLIGSFWTNPFKHPDFGFAWWSRFLITLGTYMFTTFRLLYMQEHLGLSVGEATLAVANGVLIYTIALLASAAVSGWLSDKLGRRKIFVGGSTALTAIGLVVLAQANDLSHFYGAEVLLG